MSPAHGVLFLTIIYLFTIIYLQLFILFNMSLLKK